MQVELSRGLGVYIATSEKEQLKVDYRNRPALLLRETLFVLFGKEAFKDSVTARGTKLGSQGIDESVLKAVCGKFCFHNFGLIQCVFYFINVWLLFVQFQVSLTGTVSK